MSFRAGDVVRHRPTGKEWVLAADEVNGDVIAWGWPETIAHAADCELVEAATDQERRKMLEDVAGGWVGVRTSWARQQLQADDGRSS